MLYDTESSASGTKNILNSPLEERKLKRGLGCSQQQCQGGTMNIRAAVPLWHYASFSIAFRARGTRLTLSSFLVRDLQLFGVSTLR